MKFFAENFNVDNDIRESRVIKFDNRNEDYVIYLASFEKEGRLNLNVILEKGYTPKKVKLLYMAIDNNDEPDIYDEKLSLFIMLLNYLITKLDKVMEYKVDIDINKELIESYNELFFGERVIDTFSNEIKNNFKEIITKKLILE